MRYGGYVVIPRDKLRSLWVEVDVPKDFNGDGKLSFSVYLHSASVGDVNDIVLDTETPIATEVFELEVIRAALPAQKTTQKRFPLSHLSSRPPFPAARE